MKSLIFFVILLFLVGLRVATYRTTFIDGQRVRISTKLSNQPVRYATNQKIIVKGLVVYLPLFPEINYGDFIVIEGLVDQKKLVKPQLISRQDNNGIFITLRKKLLSLYSSSLPQPHAGLIAGITLGVKSLLPEEFYSNLISSGVVHVVVASGSNITLLASYIMSMIVIFVSRKKAAVMASVFVWMYVVFVGFEAPLVRAAIMVTIALLAESLGRLYSAFWALVISAALMILYKPSWITDLGFILSFVSTLSLMVFQKRVEKFFSFVPKLVKEGLTTSISAQLGVGAILFVTFGSINFLSPLVNALVLWTIPYVMIIGALGGVLGLISPTLGKIVLLLSYPLTKWFIFMVEVFK